MYLEGVRIALCRAVEQAHWRAGEWAGNSKVPLQAGLYPGKKFGNLGAKDRFRIDKALGLVTKKPGESSDTFRQKTAWGAPRQT